MSNDVLYCLNADIKFIIEYKIIIIAHKIQLKCELLVSKDLFFIFPFLLKCVNKIHGKGPFLLKLAHNTAHN